MKRIKQEAVSELTDGHEQGHYNDTSASFLAKISFRSPRRTFNLNVFINFFLITFEIKSGSKYPTNIYLILKTDALNDMSDWRTFNHACKEIQQ